jgi:mRNA degradation ribonuclease J1/J2
MSVYEYGNDIVIVDGGLMFPTVMLGVVVIPDVTYLQDKLIIGISLPTA